MYFSGSKSNSPEWFNIATKVLWRDYQNRPLNYRRLKYLQYMGKSRKKYQLIFEFELLVNILFPEHLEVRIYLNPTVYRKSLV